VDRRRFVVPLPGDRSLALGDRTLVMGIINVTPDSFSDGGSLLDPGRAIDAGLRMVDEGADILDVGGESTRPGAHALPADEERRRVLPVVEALAARAGVPISIDTYKAAVADEAMQAGAAIVNDISGLRYEPEMAPVVATRGAALILMHTRGRSLNMYEHATYNDLMSEVLDELRGSIAFATSGGVPLSRLMVDPGLGFAKQTAHNFETLGRMEELTDLGRPIVSGPSRKGFLIRPLGRELPPLSRDWTTAAAVTASVLAGAHIVRVHDVAEMLQVARVADEIRKYHRGD
jgi:dihydropteroate synthase